jgi:hypothetical protein
MSLPRTPAAAPHPHPLPTGGRGAARPDRSAQPHPSRASLPLRWERDGVAGLPAKEGAQA